MHTLNFECLFSSLLYESVTSAKTSLTNSTVFLLFVSRRVSSTKLSQRPLQSSGSSEEARRTEEKREEVFIGSLLLITDAVQQDKPA